MLMFIHSFIIGQNVDSFTYIACARRWVFIYLSFITFCLRALRAAMLRCDARTRKNILVYYKMRRLTLNAACVEISTEPHSESILSLVSIKIL